MATRSLIPHLTDIVEAIERIQAALGDMPLEAFEQDWRRQWLVERGVEIISTGEPPPHARTESASPANPVAESGGYRQRAAPRLRKHRCAHYVEAGASRSSDLGKSLPRRTRSRTGQGAERLKRPKRACGNSPNRRTKEPHRAELNGNIMLACTMPQASLKGDGAMRLLGTTSPLCACRRRGRAASPPCIPRCVARGPFVA